MHRPGAAVLVIAASVLAACAASGAAYTPEQAEALAVRVAQVDAVERLTAGVLGVALPSGETVGEALGRGSRNEIALRVFLRSARMVGPPRVYSDGVAEVDVQVPADVVAAKVADLTGRAPNEVPLGLLCVGPLDANLTASGHGAVPDGLSEGAVRRIVSTPADALPEMFPAGWHNVSASGRVLAARAARIAAYEAMADRIKSILLGRTETVGDLVQGSAAVAAFDAYVRSLPVAGPPRFMPDAIAEVEVVTPLPRLIDALKTISRIRDRQERLTDDAIDRLSVRIKSDQMAVTGRGMPPPETIRPASAATVAGGEALPDWATEVLEAFGTAELSPDVGDAGQNQLLAIRSAKVRALADLERQVNAIVLDGEKTVQQRAAKDAVFRRDVETFLDGARMVRCRSLRDGRAWEVVLRLPLLRLYEVSRHRG